MRSHMTRLGAIFSASISNHAVRYGISVTDARICHECHGLRIDIVSVNERHSA